MHCVVRQEVQLHTLLTLYSCTLCCQTISWPLLEVLIFLFLHNISLAIKTGDLITHYIPWYPYFYGLQVFSITYPHSLALRGTLALHECVWSASHYTCIALGKTLWTNLTAGWRGQSFCLETLTKWKISWPCQETYLKSSFIYPGHRLPTTPTALSQLPFYSQSYPEYIC